MGIWEIWLSLISDPILIALSSAVLLLILLTLILLISLCRVNKKVKRINRNAKNGNLAGAIEMYYDKIDTLMSKVDDVSERFGVYERQTATSLRKTGIVYFNAFGGISGNMSFALAALSDDGNGFILTSLFGHEGSNIYIREIKNGKPMIAISEEEEKALLIALNQ